MVNRKIAMERELSPQEESVVRALYEAKGRHQDMTAYCTAAKPITISHWNGRHPVEENTQEVVVAPGATLKIVMVSRLGDMGLTDDLSVQHGYGARKDTHSSFLSDIRLTVEPTCTPAARQAENELIVDAEIAKLYVDDEGDGVHE